MFNKLHNWLIIKLAGKKTVMLNADMTIYGSVHVQENPNGSLVKGNIFRNGE